MNSAATMDGTPLRMSTMKLTARAILLPLAYSIRKIAPRMPNGTAIRAVIPEMIRVPTIAW